MITLMDELDELFIQVDAAFKFSGEKLIPIRDLLPFKKTGFVRYYGVWSHEWLISSENTYWSSLEDFDKLVL